MTTPRRYCYRVPPSPLALRFAARTAVSRTRWSDRANFLPAAAAVPILQVGTFGMMITTIDNSSRPNVFRVPVVPFGPNNFPTVSFFYRSSPPVVETYEFWSRITHLFYVYIGARRRRNGFLNCERRSVVTR